MSCLKIFTGLWGLAVATVAAADITQDTGVQLWLVVTGIGIAVGIILAAMRAANSSGVQAEKLQNLVAAVNHLSEAVEQTRETSATEHRHLHGRINELDAKVQHLDIRVTKVESKCKAVHGE